MHIYKILETLKKDGQCEVKPGSVLTIENLREWAFLSEYLGFDIINYFHDDDFIDQFKMLNPEKVYDFIANVWWYDHQ